MIRILFALVLALNAPLRANVRDPRLSKVNWYLSRLDGTNWPWNPQHFTLTIKNQDYPEMFMFGEMACNGFVAQFASPITNSLNITNWSPTLAACIKDDEIANEHEFANRMKQIATYKIEVGPSRQTLYMYDASSHEILRFITLNQTYLPIVAR